MPKDNKWPEPIEPKPDITQLEEWSYEGVCGTTDGCSAEPDGFCEHGYPAWLLYLGYV